MCIQLLLPCVCVSVNTCVCAPHARAAGRGRGGVGRGGGRTEYTCTDADGSFCAAGRPGCVPTTVSCRYLSCPSPLLPPLAESLGTAPSSPLRALPPVLVVPAVLLAVDALCAVPRGLVVGGGASRYGLTRSSRMQARTAATASLIRGWCTRQSAIHTMSIRRRRNGAHPRGSNLEFELRYSLST